MNTVLKSFTCLCLIATGTICMAAPDKNLPKAERLYYNNDITVDLGVGLWSCPIPVDYDGDGLKDLVVGCPDKPYKGLYFFRNIGTAKAPLFDKAVKICGKASNHQFSSEVDGKTIVTDNGCTFDNFFLAPFEDQKPIEFEGENWRIGTGRSRNNQWAACDWDADGDIDYLAAFDTWDDYGWDNAYDKDGNWTHGPLHGYIYLVLNENGRYVNKGRVQAGGKDIDVYGTVSPCFADFDGDGDPDIITGEFVDGFTWFENIGTRQNPVFAEGRQLGNGKNDIRMHLEMIQPRSTDWDGDGHVDLIVGDEDGRVALMRNTGKVRKGMPQFGQPVYFRQKADAVKFGALATPWSYDWDGDGEEDIIAGNSSGEIAFIRNLGGGKSWAEPVNFTVNGKVLRIMAGENGSIQGPAERKWGYTVLSVADWDGDGKADLIVNSIWGKIVWYKGLGGLKLAAAQPVRVAWSGETPKVAWNWWTPEDGTLATQWRTTPVAIDWNKDGRCDLVMLDQEGYLCYYERRDDGQLEPGKRIFRCVNGYLYNNKKGIIDSKPGFLRLNDAIAGQSGRRKICFADWDKDGKLDLIVDGPNACWFKGLGGKGGEYALEYIGDISSTVLEGHTTSPTVVDWDKDGICDVLVGAEDGHFYVLKNPMTNYSERVKLYGEGTMPCNETVAENGYIYGTIEPELLVYKPAPEKNGGRAMLIVPGGGYEKNCITFEGYKTAEWLTANGITAFILKYRLPEGNPSVTLEDGEAAIRHIRTHAAEYGIRPDRIGIIGFSAGGHFVSTMVTKYTGPETRPDFAVLVYPVISSEYDNAGTHRRLLGDKLESEGPKWTATNYVKADMPPCMIVMCSDDKAVPPKQVMDFYDAGIKAGANMQLHFYPAGGHGFWMRDRYKYGKETYPMIINWIRNTKK